MVGRSALPTLFGWSRTWSSLPQFSKHRFGRWTHLVYPPNELTRFRLRNWRKRGPVELYQAEWCSHSHRVRQRLTELGLDFEARQVAADPGERNDMKAAVGTEEIPVLVAEDGSAICGEDEILRYLDRFERR